MRKVLVFDFDGTIANSFPEFSKIVNKLADKYSFRKVREEDIARLRDYDTMQLLQELKIPLWKVPFIARDGRSELHKIIAYVTPMKGVKEQLKKLNIAGITLGILTSNSKKNVGIFLEKNDMQQFNFIYTGRQCCEKRSLIRRMFCT